MDRAQFIYHSECLDCFQFWDVMNNSTLKFLGGLVVHVSTGYVPRSEMPGSQCSKCMSTLVDNKCHTFIGCMNLYSHQQCMRRIPVGPVLTDFILLVILIIAVLVRLTVA